MVIIHFLHISCAWEDNCLQVKWEHATLQKYQLSKDHFNQIVCCGWVELVTGLYWFCPPPRLYEWQWPIYNLVVDPVICTSWLSYLLKWRWPPYQVTVHCPSSYSCGPRCARCPPWDVTNQTKPRMVFSRCSPTCLEAWRPPLLCWPSVRKIQIVSSQVLPSLPSPPLSNNNASFVLTSPGNSSVYIQMCGFGPSAFTGCIDNMENGFKYKFCSCATDGLERWFIFLELFLLFQYFSAAT